MRRSRAGHGSAPPPPAHEHALTPAPRAAYPPARRPPPSVLWIVHDIPGNETAAGRTLVPYASPSPLPCEAADELCLPEHRVTFILWEQPDGPLRLDPEDEALRAPAAVREQFQARDFAARHGLGLPLAANFFETSALEPAPAGLARAKDEL